MPALTKDVQGWPVLWDPEYGFEVRYPDGWVVADVDVADEDAPVVRAYALSPANWEQAWNPIVVEISQGTQEAFRQHYKEPGATESRSIGPLTYNYETVGQQGSAEHLAVFQSRDNPDVRIVIRDAVSGFSDRAGAGADLQSAVEQVIQSFRWRQ
jgi:hypothetical protein